MKSLTACGMTLLLATTSAHAGLVFSDNFGATTPDPTLSADVGTWSTNVLGTGLTFAPVADTNDWFGNGTSNGILRIQDTNTATNGSLAKTATFTQVIEYGVISFDLYEPSTSPSGVNTWVRINFPVAIGSKRVEFQDGHAVVQGGSAGGDLEYALDTKVAVDVYLNASNATQNIAGVSVTSGQYLIYINGDLKVTSFSGHALTVGTFNSVSISTNGSGTTEMYMDNFRVAIPEPASLSLLAVGLTAMLYRRR